MTKNVWRFGAAFYGIKKRCRKTDWHMTDKNELGEVPEETSPEELERLAKIKAKAWITENCKSLEPLRDGRPSLVAKATLWKLEPCSLGTSETWEPFTKEHNLKFPLGLCND